MVAFGVKPESGGKFYLYTQGVMYADVSSKGLAADDALSDLKFYASVMAGNNRLIITGGVKDMQYQSKCMIFDFDKT